VTREIHVDVVGDASKFNSTVDQATTKAEGFGGKLKNVGKGVSMGVGIAAFSLLGTAISGAISLLDDAHQAFLDDQVSATNLANAVKNNVPGAYEAAAAAAETFAGAQGDLGFADDDVRESLSQLVGTTHDVEEAQKLAALAMDLARAKGIDLATATDAVQKASEGQGRALKALGVDVGTSTDAATLLAAAQDNVRGSAEAWAATSEGRVAASQVKIGEAMEKVGGVIDKVAQVAIPLLAGALDFIITTFGEVWAAIQPIVSTIASTLIPIFRKAAEIGRLFVAAIINAIRTVAPVFQTVFGIIGKIVEVFANLFSTEMAIVGNVIGVLGKVFNGLSQLVGRVFGAIGGIIKGAINAVIGIVNGVIGAINSIQVHIHVGPVNLDFNGLGIPKIPRLHSGGIVPGGANSEMLAILQGGETVIPRDGGGGGNVNINIAAFYGSDENAQMFADRIARRVLVAQRPT
jgi:hypothetical protein